MKYKLVSIDIQNDFAVEGGKFYKPRLSVDFIKGTIFPFLREKKIKINEIISDYRQPRIGDRGFGCVPGQWGYESIIPEELRESLWIKSMNSPVWTRENIGKASKEPGLPCSNPEGFTKWIEENIGQMGEVVPVLFGLTIDCCVLSVLQEFSWRGYDPVIIREAVDHDSGRIEDRDIVLDRTAVGQWGKVLNWKEVAKLFMG